VIACGADVRFAPIDTKYGKHCPLSYVLGSSAAPTSTRERNGLAGVMPASEALVARTS
jgi:hypothetical protein